jgi:hypothetical protein
MIGEVGSAFETVADKQWLQDFADFINAEVSWCAVELVYGMQLQQGWDRVLTQRAPSAERWKTT